MTKAIAPELILQNIINDPNIQGLQQSLPKLAGVFAQRGKQQRLIDLSRAASDSSDPQRQINALNELAIINPQAAQVISQSTQRRQETLGNLQEARVKKAKDDLTLSASYGRAIKNAKTNEQKDRIYQNFLREAKERGLELDPKVTPQNYYEGMEEEYINPIIDQAESLGLIKAPQQPFSPEARFRADVRKGYLEEGAVSESERVRIQKGEERREDVKQKRQEVVFKQETTLRNKFQSQSKDFIKVQDSYNRILASDPTQAEKFKINDSITQFGASDLALIFNYMKILDPGSVVRESEFAVAEKSRALLTEKGVPTVLIKATEKIFAGARLTPAQREDFKDRAKELYKSKLQTHNKSKSEFSRIATNKGLDPANVIIDFEDIFINEATPEIAKQRVRRYNPQTGKIE